MAVNHARKDGKNVGRALLLRILFLLSSVLLFILFSVGIRFYVILCKSRHFFHVLIGFSINNRFAYHFARKTFGDRMYVF